MLRRRGFTLAEVLIALLLVGILSSISIQTLRNRDNSAEYEALRNKAVTNIQGVMHEALYSTMSSEIFDKNFQPLWDNVDKRLSTKTGSIKSKDGAINITTSQVMRDGVNYAYTQKDGNSHVAEITIDVNGSKAPNEEGKDIFKYNMDKFGAILLATIPDEPDKEYCPDGVTVKNSDGSNCPKCTDGSMVTTPDRSNCPKCPNGITERNADGSNCDKCANGEMANADRSNCPKCANGQEANATRSNCPMCPDGKTEKIDATGSNCVPENKCELPNIVFNGCCLPKPECGPNTTYNPNYNTCEINAITVSCHNPIGGWDGPIAVSLDERIQGAVSVMQACMSPMMETIRPLENNWPIKDKEFHVWWDENWLGGINKISSRLICEYTSPPYPYNSGMCPGLPYGEDMHTYRHGKYFKTEIVKWMQNAVDSVINKANQQLREDALNKAKNCANPVK